MGRVTHFEIHVDDPERAMTFYGRLLGWTFQRWGGIDYWLAETGPDDQPGVNGALMKRDAPLQGGIAAFVCTAEVDDVDATLAQVPGLGGAVEGAKLAVPGVGWHAYVRDSEGNLLGLMQEDPNAA